MSVIGFDTSHFWVLKRLAEQLAPAPSSQSSPVLISGTFVDLIRAHECEPRRDLVSCSYCLENELLRLPVPGSTQQFAALVDRAQLEALFVMGKDDDWANLPETVPQLSGLKFDEGDRRIAASTNYVAEANDQDAILVSDDEDFLVNLRDVTVQKLIAIFPIHSLQLLYQMHRCGRLTVNEMEALIESEGRRIDEMQLSAGHQKYNRKSERLNRLTARIATAGLEAW